MQVPISFSMGVFYCTHDRPGHSKYSQLGFMRVRGGTVLSARSLRQEGLDPGVGHLEYLHETTPGKTYGKDHGNRKKQEVSFSHPATDHLRNNHYKKGPQHRSGHRAQPTHNEHQTDLPHLIQARDGRIHQAEEVSLKSSGQTCPGASKSETKHLPETGSDSHGLGGIDVIADGEETESPTGMVDRD